MKKSLIAVAIAACVVFGGVSQAAPMGGSWSSGAGDFDAGTWQEIFYGGAEGQAGNVISASGTGWSLTGATLQSVEVLGPDQYKTIYTGGILSLDAGGPWVCGTEPLPYVANLGDLVVITTKTYDGTTLTSISWTMSASGQFNDYPDRTLEIRASYSGLPSPIEQDGFPGMTAAISSVELDVIISAAVKISPQTLNPKSKGNWITCNVTLPSNCVPAGVDAGTILLNGQISPASCKILKGAKSLMIKFSRPELEQIVQPGEVELTITGLFTDGSKFQGTNTIRVLEKVAKDSKTKDKGNQGNDDPDDQGAPSDNGKGNKGQKNGK